MLAFKSASVFDWQHNTCKQDVKDCIQVTEATHMAASAPVSCTIQSQVHSLESRMSELQAASRQLLNAAVVVIVGGGSVGVELAAELVDKRGTAVHVTIVTRSDR